MHCQQLRPEHGIVTTRRATRAEAPWATREHPTKASLEMDCQAMPLVDIARLTFHLRKRLQAEIRFTTEKHRRLLMAKPDLEFLISVRIICFVFVVK